MSILKAVITAAAPDQKQLPLQSLVDQQGETKTALQLIADEAVTAGIEEIAVIICPGEQENYSLHSQGHQLNAAGWLTWLYEGLLVEIRVLHSK